MISYIIPTRDRPRRLKDTLLAIEALGDHAPCGGAEIIVADNDSHERLVLPRALRSGVPVRELRLGQNHGAAARNHAARASSPDSGWLVMLDDDSFPLDLGFAAALTAAPADVLAISADIHLSPRDDASCPRESGGLPEVFIGCGVALRRDAFLRLGGYDPAFGYYVEEYDLAARLLLQGGRVQFNPAFRVTHAKDASNRRMDLILSRLVRNNGWVAQRYAPEPARLPDIRETRRRYRAIAAKEHALAGFGAGLAELRRTIRAQARTPMPASLWDRFTGLAHARTSLQAAYALAPFHRVAIVDEGKNAWAVRQALSELGARLTAYGEDADALVIGTLSPGPMLDAYATRLRNRYPGAPRVLAPWTPTTPTATLEAKPEAKPSTRTAA